MDKIEKIKKKIIEEKEIIIKESITFSRSDKSIKFKKRWKLIYHKIIIIYKYNQIYFSYYNIYIYIV